jgi:hypothetical protein
MSFADELPDDATDMVSTGKCTCRWDWVPKPGAKVNPMPSHPREQKKDYSTALAQRGAYPPSVPQITFSTSCGIAAHREKAGTIKVLDNL